MSVSSVGSGSLPEPSAYTYSPSLPTGLSGGSAPATASSSASSTTSSTSSTPSTSGTSATSSSSTISPYVAEYNSLQSYDAAELIQVSLDSPTAAASNVDSVLAQAAELQSEESAAQNAAAAAAANADIQGTSSSSTSSADNPLSDIPSYESIISQSDTDAFDAINASLGISTSGTSSSLGAGSSTNSVSSLDSLLGLSSSGSASSTAASSTSTSSDNPLNIPSYEQVINGTGGSLGSTIDTTA